MAGLKPLIRIGAGKGKLLKVTNQYLKSLGIEEIDEDSRLLIHYRETEKYTLKITLLRWEDIKNYADEFELIIFGSDQWLENGKKSMIALKHFEQKNCRLSLLVPKEKEDLPVSYFLDKKVATGYLELAKNYMGIKQNRIVKMTGSVEASINLGWADSIFDIVESGETAKVNGLVEKKTFIKFGAVLATCKPENIPMFQDLKLIDKPQARKIIAFDGVDGSGKSSLAKHFVQEGLGDNNPIVLMCPYSGYIGTTARALLDSGKYVEWAYLIGANHWRPVNNVDMVYDRSILTCLTELIKHHSTTKDMLSVINSFEELPKIIFWCNSTMKDLTERTNTRTSHDEYDSLDSLKEYKLLYEMAVEFVRKNTNIKVVKLNTSKEIEKTIEDVRSNLRCVIWDTL